MTDFDIYDDVFGCSSTINEEPQPTCEDIQAWKKEIEETKKRLKRLIVVNCELKAKCEDFETQMSSLLMTCKSEVNRKNQMIADLRRELDDVILRRTKVGNLKEFRQLVDRLKDILRVDKPPRLKLPKAPKKVASDQVEISRFLHNDVFTFKIGRTSFSCVTYGDVKDIATRPSVVTFEQRRNALKDMTVEPEEANRPTESLSKYQDKAGPSSAKLTTILKDSTLKDLKLEGKSDRSKGSSARRSDEGKRSSRSRKSPDRHGRRSDKENSRRPDRRDRSSRDRSEDQSSRSGHRRSRSPDRKRVRSNGHSSKSDSSKRSNSVNAFTKAKCAPKSKPNAPEVTDMETTDIETLLVVKQRELANLAEQEKKLLDISPDKEASGPVLVNTESVSAPDEAAQDANNVSINGLLNTSNFLENWPTSSFAQYRTPPPKKREREDSEASSNNGDFNSIAGIAGESFALHSVKVTQNHVVLIISAILKGKLVPGSYVSPRSGNLYCSLMTDLAPIYILLVHSRNDTYSDTCQDQDQHAKSLQT